MGNRRPKTISVPTGTMRECEDGLEVKVWAGDEARWGGKPWG